MKDYLVKAVRLPTDLTEEIIAIAKERDSTFSSVVRDALDSYVQGQYEKLCPPRTNENNDVLSQVEIENLMEGLDDETPDDEPSSIIVKSA